MEVAERHVVGARGEGRGGHAVVVEEVRGALAAAGLPAHHHEVGDEHVDGVVAEARGEQLDGLAHPLGVAAAVLVGVEAHQVGGGDDVALAGEGHDRETGPLAPRLDVDDPAVVRAGEHRDDLHPPEGQQGRHRGEAAGVVVVARHHDDRAVAVGGELEQGAVHAPLGVGARRGGVEQVARHQHEVDRLGVGDADDLGQDGVVLVGP